jgi:excisionase family DNA binding protein
MTIDWSDTTLRTLDELAATAFPAEAGITKNTLKRRIREGTLAASRPGRQFLSSYADVHAMIECLQVKTVRHRTKPAFPKAAWRRAEMERSARGIGSCA